ncbi:DUF4192 family protein [Glycomyces sp. NPDC046736]|uniref:DUF4192 family protein n=1 Tax=Glycomyces sp. NPDC046736 TaxID=3155615 RepID=UPI0033DC6FF2
MNLPVYKSVGDFASLEPGTVAGLVPLLFDQRPCEQLVAIAIGPKGPVHLSAWLLTDLDAEDGPDRFETVLAPVQASGIWLIGFSADLTNIAAAVAGLLDFLETPKWGKHWTAIAVTNNGRQWGYVDDHIDQTDPEQLQSVPVLDPLWAHLAALTVKAMCARALGFDAPENKESRAMEVIIADLRESMSDEARAQRRWADELSLLEAMEIEDSISAAAAINLGQALVDSPSLMSSALHRIASSPDRAGVGLWRKIVEHTSGQAQSLGAILAGFAAWRTGDVATACAAVTVAYPDRQQQPAARVLAELMSTGISADALLPTAPGRDGEENTPPDDTEPSSEGGEPGAVA